MKKILILFLLISASIFATEGEWDFDQFGNYSISYIDSEELWNGFESLTEDIQFISKSSIELPEFRGYSIVVIMQRFVTQIWVNDAYQVYHYIIEKE
jgi:hypothetical protein